MVVHVSMTIQAKALKIAFFVVQFVAISVVDMNILAVINIGDFQTTLLASIIMLLSIGSADSFSYCLIVFFDKVVVCNFISFSAG